MKKENKTKKFTIWDSIVLLILIVILIPFLLNVLSGFVNQNYQSFFINLALSIFTIWGIVSYIKKLVVSIKNKKK